MCRRRKSGGTYYLSFVYHYGRDLDGGRWRGADQGAACLQVVLVKLALEVELDFVQKIFLVTDVPRAFFLGLHVFGDSRAIRHNQNCTIQGKECLVRLT